MLSERYHLIPRWHKDIFVWDVFSISSLVDVSFHVFQEAIFPEWNTSHEANILKPPEILHIDKVTLTYLASSQPSLWPLYRVTPLFPPDPYVPAYGRLQGNLKIDSGNSISKDKNSGMLLYLAYVVKHIFRYTYKKYKNTVKLHLSRLNMRITES